MRRTSWLFTVAVLFSLAVPTQAAAQSETGALIRLPGMRMGGAITRDSHDIASIWALTEWDLFYLQGFVHAEDRLFQMDVTRRQLSGTLAELVGSAALPSDVQLRTIGLRRAAYGSLAAASSRARAILDAYAAGVNQWVATHALPPEYAALEITKIPAWTPLDSVTVAKGFAFQLSFDLDTTNTVALLTYQATGQALGFDGVKLFSEDLFRSAPFDPFTTIPGAHPPIPPTAAVLEAARELNASGTLELLLSYEEKARQVPLLRSILDRNREASSNEFAIAPALSASGRPLLANDPHLSLGTPAIWYPISLRGGDFNVAGNSFAGVPLVIHGENEHIAWGSTVNPMDVTDTFKETIVPMTGSLTGVGTLYKGKVEPIIVIPEVFRTNQPGNGAKDDVVTVPATGSIPPATLIVPRRDYGPIITPDTLGTGSALSVQYTGFSRTRELDAFLLIDLAASADDVKSALRYFDVGSQNFAVIDDGGNIAYLTSAEMPLREDLQANTVNGLPPWFVRDGSGGNEWLPSPATLAEDQAVLHQILPYAEMPQMVNPAQGWFANGNNDPVGTTILNNPLGRQRPGGGIYYLNPGYDGFRGGRIAQLIQQKIQAGGKFTRGDLKRIQADTVMIDAQFFVPYITRALANAQSPDADPVLARVAQGSGVAALVSRLGAWDFSAPTGLKEGWDAGKPAGVEPTAAQVQASTAATIYALWRSAFLFNVIDAPLAARNLPLPPGSESVVALRHLLETFPTNHGVGASGLNFFAVEGVSRADDRRDILILVSVANAYAMLRSEEFAPAFDGSPSLDDYRWGKLHRIVFAHPLGGPFNIPPAGGAFPNPLGDALPGIPRQGGYEVVDRSDHNVRASTVNGFMFSSGPSRRYVGEAFETGIEGENSLPGGVSGVVSSPHYFSLLPMWLVNGTYPVGVQKGPVIPWR